MSLAGFINHQGDFVIEPKYARVKPFLDENIATVQIDNYWVFIDRDENHVFPVEYEEANPFRDGVATVKINGKWGVINTEGELIVENVYDSMHSLFIDRLCIVKKEDLYGFIDVEGNTVIPIKYKHVDNFSEGLAQVAEPGCYSCYINRLGETVIPSNFLGGNNFSEGFAVVRIQDPDFIFGRPVVIDKSGNRVIDDKRWGTIGYFKCGLAVVLDNECSLQGCINQQGELVIPCIYEDVTGFYVKNRSTNLPAVSGMKHNGKYGLIDVVGKIICEPQFSEIRVPFSEGVAPAYDSESDMYGYINTSGDLVIPFKFSNTFGFENQLAAAWVDEN